MFKIREIEIPNKVVLAPMAGVCNAAFRLTAKEFGAGLVCAEMVSDKAILFNNQKTMNMLYIDPRERPLSLQIFGGEAETLVAAAKYVDKNTEADIIDINMGCPVPKITKSDSGSKLLLDPNKIYDVVSRVVDAVSKPVTVKMRIGWDDDHIYLLENALNCEKAGASAIAIHGRTKVQMYSGEANWDYVKLVKENLKIPVIGNGDITTPEMAKKRLEETGCDAVMIGRAALGNPWMLYRTVKYLETGELIGEPTPREKIDVCLLHLRRLMEIKPERVAVHEMRKHAAYYMKGIKGGAKVKAKLNELNTYVEMEKLLNDYVDFVESKEKKILI
ncbi:tRNA dihydrouridine synthase DusB [Gemella sp. GH3]|uniref:tRNA dihydrouridine synthase DusB n=1 Tax=unclassified Gemella TaxID=2624949 RepID=UPI0015D0ACE3|nr:MULTISPECIES: tRNA dihydrouridine synthase DusB [unclassified Gemella]MBF0713554.1 tRNA dihydrouridine synthase DusB [Gemella sp. GH3.1]NYS50506.1 tRNA dihydrouridine synthase DusB [Gemella sp. GH3]